jgi:hypothetical protein
VRLLSPMHRLSPMTLIASERASEAFFSARSFHCHQGTHRLPLIVLTARTDPERTDPQKPEAMLRLQAPTPIGSDFFFRSDFEFGRKLSRHTEDQPLYRTGVPPTH